MHSSHANIWEQGEKGKLLTMTYLFLVKSNRGQNSNEKTCTDESEQKSWYVSYHYINYKQGHKHGGTYLS